MGRLKDPCPVTFCGVCTTECVPAARCGPGCNLLVCSVSCFRIHRKRGCLRTLDARYQVGVLSIGRDPGWVWSILSENVDVQEVKCESRSLDLPPVLVVHLALPAAFFRTKLRDAIGVDLRNFRQQVDELVKCLKFVIASERRFFFAHPHVSCLWSHKPWISFLTTLGIACEQGGAQGEVWTVHNFTVPCVCV